MRMCLGVQILWLGSLGAAEGGRLEFQEKLHGLVCYPPPGSAAGSLGAARLLVSLPEPRKEEPACAWRTVTYHTPSLHGDAL